MTSRLAPSTEPDGQGEKFLNQPCARSMLAASIDVNPGVLDSNRELFFNRDTMLAYGGYRTEFSRAVTEDNRRSRQLH